MDKITKTSGSVGLIGLGILAVWYFTRKPTNTLSYSVYDLNKDGKVDQADVEILKQYFGKAVDPSDPLSVACDFNHDGVIDISDFGELSLYAGVLKGDINGDGKVDQADIQEMENIIIEANDPATGLPYSDAKKAIADINGDGRVNVLDLTSLERIISGGGWTPVPVTPPILPPAPTPIVPIAPLYAVGDIVKRASVKPAQAGFWDMSVFAVNTEKQTYTTYLLRLAKNDQELQSWSFADAHASWEKVIY